MAVPRCTLSPHALRSNSEAWYSFFDAKRAIEPPIPWELGATLSAPERDAITASVQEFQLGESSEGHHLLQAARHYAQRTGDQDYLGAIQLFIQEEQRHARWLGHFLAIEQLPTIHTSWADDVFRSLRRNTSLEGAISVLLTAEIIAQVYYAALHAATRSPLLQALCQQVLRDEVAHVRFQSERLTLLRRGRSQPALALTAWVQRSLFASASLVVWRNHRPVLERGGFGFQRYWARCWRAFERAAVRMDPIRNQVDPPGPSSTPKSASYSGCQAPGAAATSLAHLRARHPEPARTE